jgi:hypothetical protein
VQIPVAIYQVIFVVPKRVAFRGEDEKWDSVVGTFGGDPMGGGNTAAMGMFCLLIMLLKVSEFKHGICSLKSLVIHIARVLPLRGGRSEIRHPAVAVPAGSAVDPARLRQRRQ